MKFIFEIGIVYMIIASTSIHQMATCTFDTLLVVLGSDQSENIYSLCIFIILHEVTRGQNLTMQMLNSQDKH